MRMLTPTSFTTVTATATAAIVDVFAPIPIIVLHPTLNDAFQLQGNPAITICGGPTKSIQVNSGNTTEASHCRQRNYRSLHAGPKELGDCTLGTGADLRGVSAKPSTPPSGNVTWVRRTYVQPASPIRDPLASVNPPPVPATAACTHVSRLGQVQVPSLVQWPRDRTAVPFSSPGLYPSAIV